jgi:hypothetical protein
MTIQGEKTHLGDSNKMAHQKLLRSALAPRDLNWVARNIAGRQSVVMWSEDIAKKRNAHFRGCCFDLESDGLCIVIGDGK